MCFRRKKAEKRIVWRHSKYFALDISWPFSNFSHQSNIFHVIFIRIIIFGMFTYDNDTMH